MEGSIKGEKIQAMKNYKRSQFLYNLVLYSFTSLITFFFFSYSFWLPSIRYLFFSLQDNISSFFNAKCLFIVGNLIILVLIRESKLTQLSRSSPASDIYDEYLARSGSYHNCNVNSNVLEKKKEEDEIGLWTQSINIVEEKKHGNIKNNIVHEVKKKEMRVSKSMHHHKTKKERTSKEGMRKCKSEVWGESEIAKKKENKGEKEGKLYVDREELNERVEAFIARVNKQRLLEAKLVDNSEG